MGSSAQTQARVLTRLQKNFQKVWEPAYAPRLGSEGSAAGGPDIGLVPTVLTPLSRTLAL